MPATAQRRAADKMDMLRENVDVLEIGDLDGHAGVLSGDKGLEGTEVARVGVELERHCCG